MKKDLLILTSEEYLDRLRPVFEKFDSCLLPQEPLSRNRWAELVDNGICLPMIPKKFGGRESHYETCKLIELLSVYNLSMGMYTMIVTVLFLRNISLGANEKLKKQVFDDFQNGSPIGGLAFTEPDAGSNLSRIKTLFSELGERYQISGTKHWQAFSETADWWIILAKSQTDGTPGYFVHQRNQGGFETVQRYKSLGLKNIDYGRNKIDISVPEYCRLNKTREGLGDTIEMLTASRMSKAAMASGFLSRILNESLLHAQKRKIADRPLHDIGFVRYRIDLIRAADTICKSLFAHLCFENNYWLDMDDGLFASLAIKVLASEKMFESAVFYQQLCGGEGYRYETSNMAAYAMLDARVYTIFDGTNDLLCEHIGEIFIQDYKKSNAISVYAFLCQYEHSYNCKPFISTLKYFNLSGISRQEHIVLLGRMLSRVFGIHTLIEMAKSDPGIENNIEVKSIRSQVDCTKSVFQITQPSSRDIDAATALLKHDIEIIQGEISLSDEMYQCIYESDSKLLQHQQREA